MQKDTWTHSIPVEIKQIFLSPAHNFVGHDFEAPDHHPAHEVASVEAVAGKGLRGDRYFDHRDDYIGQATFFSWEVFQDLEAAASSPLRDPSVFRRNVIISGLPLKDLIGQRFAIAEVVMEGTQHCKPCRWMDKAYGAGALASLRGRGGLRVKILEGGTLRTGAATLYAHVPLDPHEAATPIPAPNLP